MLVVGASLHVTNGDVARERIERLGLGGRVLAWQDALHEGPVPAGLDAAGVREVRARFLASRGCGAYADVIRELEERDALLASAMRAGPVVLWFEHDLYDQLQLLQILEAAPSDAYVELVQAAEYLSELDLAALWETRTSVDEPERGAAREAWAAVRSPEPAAVEQVLAEDTSPLPFVPSALRRLLQELPWTSDGLSRTERQLLRAVAEGAAEPGQAFCRAIEHEEAAFLGDAIAFDHLVELASGEAPLLTGPPYRLTPHGEAVLAGEADRVVHQGIDRWLGGVQLVGRNVWRWDESTGRVVAPGIKSI
jgi:hypothetical protein